jgi:hypothetical protein
MKIQEKGQKFEEIWIGSSDGEVMTWMSVSVRRAVNSSKETERVSLRTL